MANIVKTSDRRIELLKAFARRREKRVLLPPQRVTLNQETVVLEGRSQAGSRLAH